MYVLVFIVPHVDIELEDNKQFISNIPRNYIIVGMGKMLKRDQLSKEIISDPFFRRGLVQNRTSQKLSP